MAVATALGLIEKHGRRARQVVVDRTVHAARAHDQQMLDHLDKVRVAVEASLERSKAD